MFTNTHPFMTGVDLVSAPLRYEGLTWSPHQQHPLSKVVNEVRKPIEFHRELQDCWFTFTSTLTWVRTVAPSLSFSLRVVFASSPAAAAHSSSTIWLFSAPSLVSVCVRVCACVPHKTHVPGICWLAAGRLVWEIPGHDQWREGFSWSHSAPYCPQPNSAPTAYHKHKLRP